MAEVLTVAALNLHIKQIMDCDPILTDVFVGGELSNYKTYPSGHHYFSLKDAEGSIRCVMFRREASTLRFRPQNGMQVVAAGRVTVFPRDGQYQLYCTRLMPDGIGDLHIAFEQIKEKLCKEGLFDAAHKKPLPRFPTRIALVTSPAGAAVQDMLRILAARYPAAQIYVVPVRVQGEEAAGEICAALAMLNRHHCADLIITGRGGGSMEDLWAFNEERVARALFASEIPVISAVGHEPDVTIADYVADLRAATPSNAAELAVPDRQELLRLLQQSRTRMEQSLGYTLREGRRILERAERSPWLKAPLPLVQESRFLLDYQQQRMVSGLQKTLFEQKRRLTQLAASLDALSPLKVLGRGYSLLQREDGRLTSSAAQIEIGERIDVRLADGLLHCLVEGKETTWQKKS